VSRGGGQNPLHDPDWVLTVLGSAFVLAVVLGFLYLRGR
jgi:hypothetical protein